MRVERCLVFPKSISPLSYRSVSDTIHADIDPELPTFLNPIPMELNYLQNSYILF